jgi:hypothetical protein
MIAMAERIAQGLDDPYASTMIQFAKGIGEFMQGSWSQSIRVLDEATMQFAKTCLDVHWELGTARVFALYSMNWAGRLSEYQRRATALHAAAVSCGDFYAELSLGTYELPFLRLVADQPRERQMLVLTCHAHVASIFRDVGASVRSLSGASLPPPAATAAPVKAAEPETVRVEVSRPQPVAPPPPPVDPARRTRIVIEHLAPAAVVSHQPSAAVPVVPPPPPLPAPPPAPNS